MLRLWLGRCAQIYPFAFPDLRLDNSISTVPTPRDVDKCWGGLTLLCPGNNDDLVCVRGAVAQLPATQEEILSDSTSKAMTKGREGATAMRAGQQKANPGSVRPSEHFFHFDGDNFWLAASFFCDPRKPTLDLHTALSTSRCSS